MTCSICLRHSAFTVRARLDSRRRRSRPTPSASGRQRWSITRCRVAWRCPQVPASGVQAGTGTSVPGLLYKNPQPYYSQWNLGVEQQLTSKMVLHLNYAGSKGTHLPITYRPNDLQPRYLVPWAIRVAGSRHTFRLPCRIPCTARLEQVASLLIRRCPAAVAAGLSAVRANGHVTAEWNAFGDPG